MNSCDVCGRRVDEEIQPTTYEGQHVYHTRCYEGVGNFVEEWKRECPEDFRDKRDAAIVKAAKALLPCGSSEWCPNHAMELCNKGGITEHNCKYVPLRAALAARGGDE